MFGSPPINVAVLKCTRIEIKSNHGYGEEPKANQSVRDKASQETNLQIKQTGA